MLFSPLYSQFKQCLNWHCLAVISLVSLVFLLSACSEPQSVNKKAMPLSDVLWSDLKDYKFTDLADKPHDLSQWAGHVVVVNFWATWCPPCRREMPEFIKVYDEYKDKKLVVIGIAVDEKTAVTDFSKKYEIPFPILLGEMAAVKLSRQLGNHHGAMPYTVVFDKQGKVQQQMAGELSREDILSYIKPLL